jgi:hypothetical protein
MEQSLTEHNLERVFFADSAHGWAVGFGGTIIALNSAASYVELPRLRQ